MNEHGEIILYQSEDGLTKIDVRFEDETVWLTQQQMAELFQSSRSNIVEHIQHIYEEGELDEAATCRKFRQVRTEGSRQVTRVSPVGNRPLEGIYDQGLYAGRRAIERQWRWGLLERAP